MDMPNLEPLEREHGAWMDACAELRKLGIDVNDPRADRAIKAFRKWGEELVVLRAGQDPEEVTRMRERARKEFSGQYEEGSYPRG
jgi:hypothetical protein